MLFVYVEGIGQVNITLVALVLVVGVIALLFLLDVLQGNIRL